MSRARYPPNPESKEVKAWRTHSVCTNPGHPPIMQSHQAHHTYKPCSTLCGRKNCLMLVDAIHHIPGVSLFIIRFRPAPAFRLGRCWSVFIPMPTRRKLTCHCSACCQQGWLGQISSLGATSCHGCTAPSSQGLESWRCQIPGPPWPQLWPPACVQVSLHHLRPQWHVVAQLQPTSTGAICMQA